MTNVDIGEIVGANYGKFWNFKGRYRVIKGGRGSKKSTTEANWAIYHLLKHPYANMLCVRQRANTLKDSCWAELKKACARMGVSHLFNFTKVPLEATIKHTGQKILFRGFDNPDSITSITVSHGCLCWVWIEEAYEIDFEEDFDKLDGCIRGSDIAKFGLFPQITFTFNPWKETWIKGRFFDVQRDNILAMTRNWYHNEFLSEADRQWFRDMKENNPETYKIAGEGEWGIPGDSYFSEFRERIHKIEPFEIPKDWRRYVSFDYGLDMFACYFIAVDNYMNYYVYKEIYEPGLIVSEAVNALKSVMNEQIYSFIAPPDMWNRRQETGKSIAEIFSEYDIPLVKASNNRIQGWYNLKEALKVYTDEQGIETAQLKIFKNCTNLLRTLPQVQHDEKEPNDIAKEPHELTHAPDALRYFIAGRPSRNIEKKKEVKYNFEAERPADINRYTCEKDIVV